MPIPAFKPDTASIHFMGPMHTVFEHEDCLALICENIRDPLNAIVGLADILSNPQCRSQRQQECAAMLYDSSKILKDRINSLLDSFQWIERGAGQLAAL